MTLPYISVHFLKTLLQCYWCSDRWHHPRDYQYIHMSRCIILVVFLVQMTSITYLFIVFDYFSTTVFPSNLRCDYLWWHNPVWTLITLRRLICYGNESLLIVRGLHSHNTISVEIGKQFYNKGKNFWKLNASLLYGPEYVTVYQDKGLIWEIIKLRMESLSAPFYIKGNKSKN